MIKDKNTWQSALARALDLRCIIRPAFAALLAFGHHVAHANDQAIALDVIYVGEVWTVTRGSLDEDLIYLDNLDILLRADLERSLGWRGAKAFVNGLYTNGQRLSQSTGDVQIISNIEGLAQSFRLFEAWLEQGFQNHSLKIGIMDINTEFDVLDSATFFIQSGSGMGSTFALSGEVGAPTFPVSALGARLHLQLSDSFVVRAAIFDGVPGDPERPAATVVRLGNGDGAFLALEAQLTLPKGKVLLGHWRYTADFDAFDTAGGGANAGYYIRAEHQLLAHRAGNGRGLSGFMRLGSANGAFNAYNRFIGAGLAYTGLSNHRPADKIGLGIAAALTSKDFRQARGFEKAETSIELTYRAQLTDYVALQPDVQYIINPSANPLRADVLAFGLRAQIGVSF